MNATPRERTYRRIAAAAGAASGIVFAGLAVWADVVVAPLHGASRTDFLGFMTFLVLIGAAITGTSLLVLRNQNWVPAVQAVFGVAIVILGTGNYEPATLSTWLFAIGILLLIASTAGYAARRAWIRRLVEIARTVDTNPAQADVR